MTAHERILVSIPQMATQLRMTPGQLVGLIDEGIVQPYVVITRSGKHRHLLCPTEVELAIRPYLRDKIGIKHGKGNR